MADEVTRPNSGLDKETRNALITAIIPSATLVLLALFAGIGYLIKTNIEENSQYQAKQYDIYISTNQKLYDQGNLALNQMLSAYSNLASTLGTDATIDPDVFQKHSDEIISAYRTYGEFVDEMARQGNETLYQSFNNIDESLRLDLAWLSLHKNKLGDLDLEVYRFINSREYEEEARQRSSKELGDYVKNLTDSENQLYFRIRYQSLPLLNQIKRYLYVSFRSLLGIGTEEDPAKVVADIQSAITESGKHIYPQDEPVFITAQSRSFLAPSFTSNGTVDLDGLKEPILWERATNKLISYVLKNNKHIRERYEAIVEKPD